ncbi:MAG: GNAT family N-acetyltransferase [Chloroflexi bacterium]|nr:GNAT family N-acetyltransferase [Chloroflexota bacterium]
MADPLILPIRADQIASAAHVMASAFADAPRFRFLVPEDAQRQAKLRWYWRAAIRACLLSGGVVHAAQEEPEGAVRGVAIWDSPMQRPPSFAALLRSGLWTAPLRLGLPAWRRRRSLGSALATLESPPSCWYLNAIGVDPSAQRGGLGSGLINRMLARADDDALPAFLDTSAPDNLGYYERFGFRVTEESTLPNGIPLWGMTRYPVTGRAPGGRQGR